MSLLILVLTLAGAVCLASAIVVLVCAVILGARKDREIESAWQADVERRKAILSSGFTADIELLPADVRQARQEFMERERLGQ